MANVDYLSYLSSLLDGSYTIDNALLDINIYKTLLNLNNHNYRETYYEEELATIENYLRKLNNLKVKIQLKRKTQEIDALHDEILTLHDEFKTIISKYNINNLDDISIINSKDDKELTKLIDSETKEKMRRMNNKSYYDELRDKLINLLPVSSYQITDDVLSLTSNEETFNVSLKEFYEVFEYLLNIDTYPQSLVNNKANRNHTIMSANIIKFLLSKEKIDEPDKIFIPIVLTNLMTLDISNNEDIDTSKFKIDNIKISDLYSLADQNKTLNLEKTAKWRKINIPNEYLYKRIKEIVLKGTYYFDNDIFILENIDNNTSDFKISIPINDMKSFLQENITNLENKVTISK